MYTIKVEGKWLGLIAGSIIAIYLLGLYFLSSAYSLDKRVSTFNYEQMSAEGGKIQVLRQELEADVLTSKQKLDQHSQNYLGEINQAEQLIAFIRDNKHLIEDTNRYLGRLKLLAKDDLAEIEVVSRLVSVPTDWVPLRYDLSFCGNTYKDDCKLYQVRFYFDAKITQLDKGFYSNPEAVFDDVFKPSLVHFHEDELDWHDAHMNQNRAYKVLTMFESFTRGNTRLVVSGENLRYQLLADFESAKIKDLPIR